VANFINTRSVVNYRVRGVPYEPSGLRKSMASVAMVVQLSGFACVFAGTTICQFFGLDPTPPLIDALQQNKMMSFVVLFFVGNLVQSTLTATHAFEIYKGRQLVWSSLSEGRLPQMDDIMTTFKEAGIEVAL